MKIVWLCIITPILMTCTSNPIFDNTIENEPSLSVEGQVFLDGDDDNSGVYVYYEGLGYSVYTDSMGFYKFELPPVNLQPGNGLNGIFKIYYYLNNYRIDSSSTLLINGELQYGSGDIKADGTMRSVVLNKLLDIRVYLLPDQISNLSKDTLDIRIGLVPIVDSLTVSSYKRSNGQTSCIIILKENEPDERSIFLQGAGASLSDERLTTATEWRMVYIFSAGFFGLGKYDFIPYIIIKQDGIPQELLDSIDPNLQDFSHEYLLTPTKQSFGKLMVFSESPI